MRKWFFIFLFSSLSTVKFFQRKNSKEREKLLHLSGSDVEMKMLSKKIKEMKNHFRSWRFKEGLKVIAFLLNNFKGGRNWI